MSREAINLDSWVEESNRRGEEITVYMVNETTKDVVYVAINPGFIAQLMKVGEATNYELR